MREMTYAQAIEDALAQAMAEDERVVVFGEDVEALRMNLHARFGPRRVRNAPISESAFLGAAVGAAMAGLRPVAELIMIDFLAVAADALVNHAAKVEAFSGGRWRVPMVVRAGCGGGYGDGGQHEQTLWGWLAHIPGLKVAAPSTPADAGGLLIAAIEDEGPVVFLEHQLLAEDWLEYLGSGGRVTVDYDIPKEGCFGEVPDRWEPIPLGKATVRRTGRDLTIAGVGVGIHRAAEAADRLAREGISASVIDLRCVAPLDRDAVVRDVRRTGRLLVVDEDYRDFGLSGELAATLLEAGMGVAYARVAVEGTIPFDPARERDALPNADRIVEAARGLMQPGAIKGSAKQPAGPKKSPDAGRRQDEPRHPAPERPETGKPAESAPPCLLKLHKSYYERGFFNLGVAMERFVRPDSGPAEVVLGDSGAVIPVRVNREANANGTPRVMGGAELRNWLQQNFELGDSVEVIIESPARFRIRRI